MNIRYVTLDPTGNITCLVTDPLPRPARAGVTAALMDRCEQVGYLCAPCLPGARARIEMMGGEFCGNAAMASAAYLYACGRAEAGGGVPLEVSGAEGIVPCAVRPLPDGGFEGTVEMPPVREIADTVIGGFPAVKVRMDGITHLILESPVTDEAAEALLRKAASESADAALGLLLWDGEEKRMRPLVWVRESGTAVWETGCGSGSTAVGAYLAFRRGDGYVREEIRQPGGVILAEAQARGGRVAYAAITGHVRVGPVETLIL